MIVFSNGTPNIEKKEKEINNLTMKRLSLFLIILLCFSSFLFSGVIPVSGKVGKVCTEVKEGSVEEMVLKAMGEEFSLSWIEKYCDTSDGFLASYSPLLSSILPMEEIVLGLYDGNSIRLYSRKTGDCLSIIIKEGRISALQKD